MTMTSQFPIEIFQEDKILLEKGKNYIVESEDSFFIKDIGVSDIIIKSDGGSVYEVQGLIDSEQFIDGNIIHDFLDCTISDFLDGTIENWVGGEKISIEESIENVKILLDGAILELDIDYSITPQFSNIYGNFVDRLVFNTAPTINSEIRIKMGIVNDFRANGKSFNCPYNLLSYNVWFVNSDESKKQKIEIISPNENVSNVRLNEAFPRWMRHEYPLFHQFVEDYLSQTNQIFESKELLRNSDRYKDIDLVPEKFLDNYSQELLHGISPHNSINHRLLIKHISDFFGVRGMRNSYDFLMRISFGESCTIKIPKENLIQLSGGKYEIQTRLRVVAPVEGVMLFPGKFNSQMTSTNSDILKISETKIRGSSSRSTAIVEETYLINVDGKDVVELIVSGVVGEFSPWEKLEVIEGSDDKKLVTAFVVPVVDGLETYLIDQNWLDNDLRDFDADFILAGGTVSREQKIDFLKNFIGKEFSIKGSKIQLKNVSSTDISIEIIDQGGDINSLDRLYLTDYLSFPLNVSSTFSSGRKLSSHGSTSNGKNIQDGIYYQRHSYDVESNVPLKKWERSFSEIVHPRGLGVFGTNKSKDIHHLFQQISLKGAGVVSEDPINPYADEFDSQYCDELGEHYYDG